VRRPAADRTAVELGAKGPAVRPDGGKNALGAAAVGWRAAAWSMARCMGRGETWRVPRPAWHAGRGRKTGWRVLRGPPASLRDEAPADGEASREWQRACRRQAGKRRVGRFSLPAARGRVRRVSCVVTVGRWGVVSVVVVGGEGRGGRYDADVATQRGCGVGGGLGGWGCVGVACWCGWCGRRLSGW
jgi:hypothetical protein